MVFKDQSGLYDRLELKKMCITETFFFSVYHLHVLHHLACFVSFRFVSLITRVSHGKEPFMDGLFHQHCAPPSGYSRRDTPMNDGLRLLA